MALRVRRSQFVLIQLALVVRSLRDRTLNAMRRFMDRSRHFRTSEASREAQVSGHGVTGPQGPIGSQSRSGSDGRAPVASAPALTAN